MRHLTFVLFTVLFFGLIASTTLQPIFAQEGNNDLAIVSINKYVDGIPTGTVYIFDQNYSLIKILNSSEKPTLGQFSGDITYKDNKLVLSTPSRENEHMKTAFGPLSRVGAISIFDGMTGSLFKTIWNPEPNTVKDYVGGTFGASITHIDKNIIVGNPNLDVNGVRAAGTVYVFDDAGNLLLTIKNPSPTEAAGFGGTVASWNDKIIVAISGRTVGNTEYAGVVSVYDAKTGNLLKTIENPNPALYARFGSAMDTFGNNLLIAAPFAVVDDEKNAGAVYLYDANTGNLIKTIKNPDPDEGDYFGRSVMFAGDKIVIGATGNGSSNEGSVYIYDESGTLLNTIHSPDKTAKSGLYSNEFGVSLAFEGNRLAIGDDSKMVNGVRAGAVYIYDITSGNLLRTIDNPEPESDDAFGYFQEFVGNMEPDPDVASKITEQQNNKIESGESTNSTETWIEPIRDTVSSFVGMLEYDKIPDNFKCDISPKVSYQYVDKGQPVKYPENDSLFMRIGGEDTKQDFQIVFSLWNERDSTYAKDLSYHILLKNKDNSDWIGAIYSPDTYSDYSTLGVAVEANNKTNSDGILPEDVTYRLTELFGSNYILPIGIPSNGHYQLYVRVFDSENDWVRADTCGIQAIIPISAKGEDDVTVDKIQFSNIKISPIKTNHENLEINKKIVDDAIRTRDIQNMQLSPRKQLELGTPADQIQCFDGRVLVKNTRTGDPMCLKPQTVVKLKERNWVQ